MSETKHYIIDFHVISGQPKVRREKRRKPGGVSSDRVVSPNMLILKTGPSEYFDTAKINKTKPITLKEIAPEHVDALTAKMAEVDSLEKQLQISRGELFQLKTKCMESGTPVSVEELESWVVEE